MSKKKLMKKNDYCYACIAVSSTGQEHVCGFSKTFAGLKDIRETYIGACHAENIEGMSFTTPERWSKNDFIDFFTSLKRNKVEWTYLLHGFVTGEDKKLVKIPDGIEIIWSLT